MKFYKLELINREQSYNAMFGAQPQVGFMNPNQQLGKAKQMAPLPPGIPKDNMRKQTQKAWYDDLYGVTVQSETKDLGDLINSWTFKSPFC